MFTQCTCTSAALIIMLISVAYGLSNVSMSLGFRRMK